MFSENEIFANTIEIEGRETCELRIFLLKILLNCLDMNRDAPCRMRRRNSQSVVLLLSIW